MAVVVAAVEESLADLPVLLTVEEAARVVRIGRTLAYDMVGRYEASGGTDGLPALRVSGCLRVPKWALAVWISTGRVVRLIPQSVEGEGAPGADEGRAQTARRPRVVSRQLTLLAPS
jgi:hypothetical protein